MSCREKNSVRPGKMRFGDRLMIVEESKLSASLVLAAFFGFEVVGLSTPTSRQLKSLIKGKLTSMDINGPEVWSFVAWGDSAVRLAITLE